MNRNDMIMLGLGVVLFFVMSVVKIPVKKMTYELTNRRAMDEEEHLKRFHRLNLILIVLLMLFAIVLYSIILILLGDSHFKLCCSLKSGAVAMALYAIVEQWRGSGR